MKPAAYILSVLMLFFTVQPLLVECQQSFADLPAAGTACCKKKCAAGAPEKKKPARDCETAGCNPFAGCSQCHYLNNVKDNFLQYDYAGGVKNKPSQNEALVTGFLNDCWHPPEFVVAI